MSAGVSARGGMFARIQGAGISAQISARGPLPTRRVLDALFEADPAVAATYCPCPLLSLFFMAMPAVATWEGV